MQDRVRLCSGTLRVWAIIIALPGCTSAHLSSKPLDGASDASSTPPVSAPLLAHINSLVDADAERLTAMYKDLHENPEIAFTEVRTAGIVSKELKELGFTVTEGVGKTGVVAILKNGPGPTVLFRADMDSNAVKEATGLPYAARGYRMAPNWM